MLDQVKQVMSMMMLYKRAKGEAIQREGVRVMKGGGSRESRKRRSDER